MEPQQAFWAQLKQKYEEKNRLLQQREQELRLKLEAMDTIINDNKRKVEAKIAPIVSPKVEKETFYTQPNPDFKSISYVKPPPVSKTETYIAPSPTAEKKSTPAFIEPKINLNQQINSCQCQPPQEKPGFFKSFLSIFGTSKAGEPPPADGRNTPNAPTPAIFPAAPQDIPTKETKVLSNPLKNPNCMCNPCQLDTEQQIKEDDLCKCSICTLDGIESSGGLCNCSVCSKDISLPGGQKTCACSVADPNQRIDSNAPNIPKADNTDYCNCSICSQNISLPGGQKTCACIYTDKKDEKSVAGENAQPTALDWKALLSSGSAKPTPTPSGFPLPSQLSLKSLDLFYMQNVQDLATQQKDLVKQIAELEQKNQIYDQVFSEYKNVDFSEKPRPPVCRGMTESDQKTNAELKLENFLLKNELKEMRLEVRQYLEKMEGPMQYKIESEKYKCVQLEQKLEEAAREMAEMQDLFEKEVNSLKMQLCTANNNVYNLNTLCEQLGTELQNCRNKCAKLEDDLIRQKLSEAESINHLQEALRAATAQANANVVKEKIQEPVVSAQIKEPIREAVSREPVTVASRDECDLNQIARELSKILKECEPCGECVNLPDDLTAAANLLKSLSDLVEGKIAEGEGGEVKSVPVEEKMAKEEVTALGDGEPARKPPAPGECGKCIDCPLKKKPDKEGESAPEASAQEPPAKESPAQEEPARQPPSPGECGKCVECPLKKKSDKVDEPPSEPPKEVEVVDEKKSVDQAPSPPAEGIPHKPTCKCVNCDRKPPSEKAKPDVEETKSVEPSAEAQPETLAPPSEIKSKSKCVCASCDRKPPSEKAKTETQAPPVKTQAPVTETKSKSKCVCVTCDRKPPSEKAKASETQAVPMSEKRPRIKCPCVTCDRKPPSERAKASESQPSEPQPSEKPIQKSKCQCISCDKKPRLDQLWPKTEGPIELKDSGIIEVPKRRKCDCAVAQRLRQQRQQQKEQEQGQQVQIQQPQEQVQQPETEPVGDVPVRRPCKCRKPSQVEIKPVEEVKVEEVKVEEVKVEEKVEAIPSPVEPPALQSKPEIEAVVPKSDSERFKLCHSVTAIQEKDLLVSETSVKCLNVPQNFPFDIDTQVDVINKPPDGVHITTTITNSGTLEVITEGPEGVIETTLIYTNSGNVEVVTEILEFKGKDIPCTKGKLKRIEDRSSVPAIEGPVKTSVSEPGKISEAIVASEEEDSKSGPTLKKCKCGDCPVLKTSLSTPAAPTESGRTEPILMKNPNCRCRDCPVLEMSRPKSVVPEVGSGSGAKCTKCADCPAKGSGTSKEKPPEGSPEGEKIDTEQPSEGAASEEKPSGDIVSGFKQKCNKCADCPASKGEIAKAPEMEKPSEVPKAGSCLKCADCPSKRKSVSVIEPATVIGSEPATVIGSEPAPEVTPPAPSASPAPPGECNKCPECPLKPGAAKAPEAEQPPEATTAPVETPTAPEPAAKSGVPCKCPAIKSGEAGQDAGASNAVAIPETSDVEKSPSGNVVKSLSLSLHVESESKIERIERSTFR